MAADNLLPTDPFDKLFARLTGLPNGAQTAPTVIQDADYYGNVTSYMVQTVRHEGGDTTFVTTVNASGSVRFILPPKVLAAIDRQREANTKTVRRRHGKRIAAERAERGEAPAFLKGKKGGR